MNIEKGYIQKLLDSYLAAETTQEEEDLLADYFCTHRDVPAEWQNFSILFRGLRQDRPKSVSLHKSYVLKWSAAAAVIAIIFGTGLFFLHKNNRGVEPSKSVAVGTVLQTEKMPHEAQAEECVQTAQISHPNNMERQIIKSDKPVVTKKPKSNIIPTKSIELQEDVCIDCELQTMEDKMLAMVNEFENM